MPLNSEKQQILKQKGNVMVTANPGTGKTLLLAHKYLSLLEQGIEAKDLLCLTFTDKARREMEHRIVKLIEENNIKIDLSDLNVFTFHSYAMQHVENNAIVSSNLLRYAIFRYIKDNDVLNYGDGYLLDTIVPKMENLIRYLKSFGINPDQIDLNKVKPFLQEGKSWTKEEIDIFAGQFIKIYQHYEEIKSKKGCDYTDLLIDFLKLKKIPQFKVVLIDELQDVNIMEADIALKSGKEYFAVGDKKQAIFGFQGGSIVNFTKFKDSSQFILSENFRSTNEILDYASDYVCARTEDEAHKKELANLRNPNAQKGEKPRVLEVERDNAQGNITLLVQSLLKETGQVTVIARTNGQVMDISKDLKEKGIECSSTHFSSSDEAKEQIILFLRGLLSDDVDEMKQVLFTPFFPMPIQEAFTLVKDRYITEKKLLESCPALRSLRDGLKTTQDINLLFKGTILPICVAYGKEHLYAGMTLQTAFSESLGVLAGRPLMDYVHYLESSDMLAHESETDKRVVVTTVHKAKGKEYDHVIYAPSKTSERSNFQDAVVEGILQSKEIDAKEELEEESLRVNFVAFTRAKRKLFIITEKPQEYMSTFAELGEAQEAEEGEEYTFEENTKKAFALFVSGDTDKAKNILSSKEDWVRGLVKSHFDSLERFSFSYMTDDAYEYFTDHILNLSEGSSAMNLGVDAHDLAEKMAKGEKVDPSLELKPYADNILLLLDQIKKDYPHVVDTEEEIKVPLSEIFDTKEKMTFKGKIDAIFNNGGDYLIVDWKTSSQDDYGAEHRQQLEVYRRAYSSKHSIPLENIKVAIGYIGLRNRINTGVVGSSLDAKQPAKSAYETINQKAQKMLRWKNDVDSFLSDFVKTQEGGPLWRSVAESIKDN